MNTSTPDSPATLSTADLDTVAVLQHEHAFIAVELTRVDNKTNQLLAAIAASVVLTASAAAAGAPRPLLWVAAGCAAVAVVALLLAIHPRIPRHGGTGWVAYARGDSQEVLAAARAQAADRPAALAGHVHTLSRTLLRKNLAIRLAVRALFAGFAALAAAVLPILG